MSTSTTELATAVFGLNTWTHRRNLTRDQIASYGSRLEEAVLDIVRDELLPTLLGENPQWAGLSTVVLARGCSVRAWYNARRDLYGFRVTFPAPEVGLPEETPEDECNPLTGRAMDVRLEGGAAAGQSWEAIALRNPDAIETLAQPDPWELFAGGFTDDTEVDATPLTYRRTGYDAVTGEWVFTPA